MRKVTFILLIFIVVINLRAQPPAGVHWSKSGNSYYEPTSDGIIEYSLPTFSQKIIVTAQQLVPKDSLKPLPVRNFFFSPDEKKSCCTPIQKGFGVTIPAEIIGFTTLLQVVCTS